MLAQKERPEVPWFAAVKELHFKAKRAMNCPIRHLRRHVTAALGSNGRWASVGRWTHVEWDRVFIYIYTHTHIHMYIYICVRKGNMRYRFQANQIRPRTFTNLQRFPWPWHAASLQTTKERKTWSTEKFHRVGLALSLLLFPLDPVQDIQGTGPIPWHLQVATQVGSSCEEFQGVKLLPLGGCGKQHGNEMGMNIQYKASQTTRIARIYVSSISLYVYIHLSSKYIIFNIYTSLFSWGDTC